jgi:hypothetical protein
MGRAYIFFPHTASNTPFSNSMSASISLSSRFSRSNSFNRRASLIPHVSKLPLPPVKAHLRDVRLLTEVLDAFFTAIRLAQYPNLVFRRIPFAFHRLVLS